MWSYRAVVLWMPMGQGGSEGGGGCQMLSGHAS